MRGLSPVEARRLWQPAASGVELPGRPDLVHSHSFQAPRIARAKVVATIHDVAFWAHPDFTTEANRLVCQRGVIEAMENADGLVFISESVRNEFERFLPGWLEESGVCHTVIPWASRFEPRTKIDGVPSAGAPWFAYGSLEPRKNFGALLQAYQEYAVRSAIPRPLWIAGGRGWRSEDLWQQVTDWTGPGDVRHLGYLDDDALSAQLGNAYCLVFPSWYEGFGLPILEAMTQGCPVICSRITSLSEIGGEAAIYVDPAQPGTIADAMLTLEMTPGLRAARAVASLDQVRRFSWESTARKTLAFYRTVLAVNLGRPRWERTSANPAPLS